MSAESYFIVWRGKKTGPFSKDHIRTMLTSGEVSTAHLVESPSGTLTVKELLKDPDAPPARARKAARPEILTPPPRVVEHQGPHAAPQQPSAPQRIPITPPQAPPLPPLPPSENASELAILGDVTRPLFHVEAWIRLFGIIMLIQGILGVLGSLASAMVTFGLGAFGAIPAGITVWLGILLIQAAAELKHARADDSVESLSDSVERIASFFKVSGIFALSFVILVILAVIGITIAITTGLLLTPNPT